jgi:hypothetical protein
MVTSPTMHRWEIELHIIPVPALAGEARRGVGSPATQCKPNGGASERNGVTLGLGLRERHVVDPATCFLSKSCSIQLNSKFGAASC